jgi:hypothetical protein
MVTEERDLNEYLALCILENKIKTYKNGHIILTHDLFFKFYVISMPQGGGVGRNPTHEFIHDKLMFYY